MGEFTKINTNDPAEAEHMPWWLLRMSSDVWHFGLLLVTGQLVCIERIDSICRDKHGTMWLDVTLLEDDPSAALKLKYPCLIAPTSRCDATINADHVVAAFELAES